MCLFYLVEIAKMWWVAQKTREFVGKNIFFRFFVWLVLK